MSRSFVAELRSRARAGACRAPLARSPALAQNYPSRPVTIIVSLAAGTGMDTLVRVYGEKLSQSLGQPVVIENKPGGAGVVAGETIAKGAADGYTLAVATSAIMAIRPTLFKQRPFDPLDRLHADLALREIAVRVHRQSGAAGQLGSGVHQVCEGAAGTAQLQLVRESAARRT